MLFNIMCMLLSIFVLIFSFFLLRYALKAQKEAFLMGFEAGETGKTPKIDVKPKKSTKLPEETDENKRLNDVLFNINAYDGTGLGQKEIK